MSAPFVWYDVTAPARDADAVRDFYSKLLGWTIAPDTNPGPYNGWITDGDRPWGAVVEADDTTAGRWVPYVQVDDLDAAVATATSLGATVVAGKAEGPAGTAVTLADPAGALVALWVPFPEPS
jgi:predicted enzyme related to lactoylglutathione lyase